MSPNEPAETSRAVDNAPILSYRHADLAGHAYSPGSRRGSSGVRRPPADDADGTADDLRPRRGGRRHPPAVAGLPAARPRPDGLRPSRALGRSGGRTVARARADRL